MEWWHIGIAAVVAAFGVFIYWIKRRNRNPIWYMTPVTRGLKWINEVQPKVTAGGVLVHDEPGVAPVSHTAIDAGAANVFERAMCHYPECSRGRHTLRVVVLQGELSPETRTPCFRVPINHNNPYWNSEYDMMRGSSAKVHYILAAGQMLAAGVPYGEVVLIPSSDDAAFIERITDFEWEHCLLAHYDIPRYEATQTHGGGMGHPIIPSCDGSLGRVVSEGSSFKFVDEKTSGEMWLVR